MLQTAVRRDYLVGANIDVIEGALALTSPSDQLRRWLAGRGALLFSHPEDFAAYGFEADRWLVYLQNAFDSSRLRPLAVGEDDSSGWISLIGGRFIPNHEIGDLMPQMHSRASERFVTIFDSSVRARRTFLYQPTSQIPSIIQLVHTAAELCQRPASTSVRRVLQSV